MSQDRMERKPYHPPSLRVYGSLTALTLQVGVKPNVGTDCSPFTGSAGRADCS